jgi:GMP synthase-like glutamine amidotransferase
VEAQTDAVFSGLPQDFLTFQWHGETFDLPEGAVLLATSPDYPNQAFRCKEKAYGVQFHLEVTAGLVKQWSQVPAYQAALERVLGVGGAAKMLDDIIRKQRVLHSYARSMFENWLRLS